MPVFNTLQGPALPPPSPEEIKAWLNRTPVVNEPEYDFGDDTIQGEGWTLDDYDAYMS